MYVHAQVRRLYYVRRCLLALLGRRRVGLVMVPEKEERSKAADSRSSLLARIGRIGIRTQHLHAWATLRHAVRPWTQLAWPAGLVKSIARVITKQKARYACDRCDDVQYVRTWGLIRFDSIPFMRSTLDACMSSTSQASHCFFYI
jgi:hypothetical protein